MPPSWPVFACDQPGGRGAKASAVVTWGLLARVTKAVGAALVEDPSSFGSHSYRIGGATAYFAVGALEPFIKRLGNWRSATYLIYCWMSSNGEKYLDPVAAMVPVVKKSSFGPKHGVGFGELIVVVLFIIRSRIAFLSVYYRLDTVPAGRCAIKPAGALKNNPHQYRVYEWLKS